MLLKAQSFLLFVDYHCLWVQAVQKCRAGPGHMWTETLVSTHSYIKPTMAIDLPETQYPCFHTHFIYGSAVAHLLYMHM